ncbi:SDR family NAD(P)-dependent oxidoreductase [Jeotgalibacillus terrae]|uniref:SDR family NAD(P)-dependent oxidoreductase n=1 Tax=Jeotgalibacillus terrae TaxID=587735 RepID=A0ABW5ZLE1_9BACL|nr:SDR family oxidoreductase [Jeotgalibacillus terrae]MBM7580923.1 short-subunit dehydrogenase [Jeotgalibacillus terrae]
MNVLITGASGGIGKEFAKLYAENGYNLILAARSEDKLKGLAAELADKYTIQVNVFKSDLSKSGSAQKLYDEITAQDLSVDILINNAGVGLFGEFHKTDLQKEQEMIQLNITSLTELTKLFGIKMVDAGQGKILNVASTAAFFPGPLMAVYYASKAYVKSLTEALDNEWADHGVQVSGLYPGPTSTGFKDQAELNDSKLFKGGTMKPQAVAKIAYIEFMNGKKQIIPGGMNKLQSRASRLISRSAAAGIVRKTQERV